LVELIPKAKRPQVKYPIVDIFFRVSSGLVLMALFVYGTVFGIHLQRLKALGNIQEKIRGLLGVKEQKIFDDMVAYNDEIERSKEIAKDIVKPLAAISLFEESIHPKVRIVELNTNLAERRGVMALEAENLAVFWEQMRAFRKSAYIEKIDVAKFVLGKKGEVIFDVTVVFKFSKDIFVWDQSS
jgi:uncharacterized coiled-coil protein SlyX